MGQIIFGVQKQIPRGMEKRWGPTSRHDHLYTLISLGQSLAKASWGLEGTLLSLPGAILKETVHFHRHSPRHTRSSHMLANGTWKLGQDGWGSSLALTGKPRGRAGQPGPTVAGATLQGRPPRVWPGNLSAWAWPKVRVR